MKAMIKIFCRRQHGGHEQLCEECDELLEYANLRLDKCIFQESKTTCVKCPVHCYKEEMRSRVKIIMRYSGPRMLLHHPILAVYHRLDGRKKTAIVKKQ